MSNNDFYNKYKGNADEVKKNSSVVYHEPKKNKKKLELDNPKVKMGKKNIIVSLILILVLGVITAGFTFYSLNSKKEKKSDLVNDNVEKTTESEKNLDKTENVTIVNLNDKKRPYGVMINNHHAAWPQSGLDKAFIVYEIMVEGGITRMFALYTQDADVSKIGSCRSARHNYIDYAQENDAILVHFGSSNIAEGQYSVFKQDHIDGNYTDSSYFYRDKSLGRSLEHTAFTNSDSIKKAIQNHGFRNERNKDYLLNYVSKEVNLSEISGSQVANNVSVKYSYYQTSSYVYDAEHKYYYRSMSGQKHTDLVTGEQYHFKNIIIYNVQYNVVDKAGHQDLKNVGSGTGYYITNGYAVPITWEKSAREAQTVYKYQNGQEIEVSDGNTFIQIYPTGESVSIS